ncbi:MAG: hypothetical protein JWM47_2113 [Acidimicrobiales bacterium]|nr:hypothetical protein [Acidimicrobiales bacterium]
MTTARLLPPSKITAWLDCGHFLSLRHRVDDGQLEEPPRGFGSMAQLLADKGLEHETECLAAYRAEGKTVFEVPQRERRESFGAWVERVGDPLADAHDVIYQMPLVHNGVRGIADFLVRVDDPDTGAWSYEPVDAKLARLAAKPGHVLQLCFYADALEARTEVAPRKIHLWLGSGRCETLLTEDYRAYWRRLQGQLTSLLSAEPDVDAPPTVPEPCDHCDYCEFFTTCTDEWRAADVLHYVAGIRRPEQALLEAAGVATLAALAVQIDPVDGLRPERLQRLVGQAALQLQARPPAAAEEARPAADVNARPDADADARTGPDADTDAGEPPPWRLVEENADPVWGHGFEHLPEPDDGDVFLDFEGHPFWRADTGLFFLFGLIERDDQGAWAYREFWAHDLDEEATATRDLVAYLADRRAKHPGMHVYHYNHTERSSLERLTAQHGVAESTLAALVETGAFVDLLLVARNAVQVGAETYGLKHLERLTPFDRGHDIDQGAGAVVEYEAFTESRDDASLRRIAAYNEDDVRATRALRDWLVDHRPPEAEWRTAYIEPGEPLFDVDEQVAALHGFGDGTPEHLLGDLLEYWLREWLAHKAPLLAKLGKDTPDLLEDPEILAGLIPLGLQERTGARGQVIRPVMQFRLPPQVTDGFDPERPGKVLFAGLDGPTGYAEVHRLEPATGELDLLWNDRLKELAVVPAAVVVNDWVTADPKPAALADLANRVLDPDAHGEPNPVGLGLLRRDLPAFEAGGGPPDGTFTDDLAEMMSWVTHLDHSFVAIQGPPGTGKTYSGAHLVLALVGAGKRVGITAMSHHAIDNLLEEVIDVFRQAGELGSLTAVRRGKQPAAGGLERVTYASTNPKCAKPEFNLVAGTTWLFSGRDMVDAPVDVLLVDEAGQLALADALAASHSAHNLVLLGDPLQLAQVSQASHPGGAGASVLEHVLGDDVTIKADRGVFLSETRRMHPDVCGFISEQIYEGNLACHSTCGVQCTTDGTGLRWLRAGHTGRSTESIEEAEVVAAEIARLLGHAWTDKDGVDAPLTVTDFMVVAPFNDQVKLIREVLDRDARTAGVPVGTVDKFQGREAAVVFFTMTTSSGDDMTRGADFLFSRNRLNVAISRARCLAYLVCTGELLDTRARTVPEMRLISTLDRFVEHCSAGLPNDPAPAIGSLS